MMEKNEDILKDSDERYIKKISKLFKNPYSAIFFVIILFTVGIRLYFFLLTKNQPLWWDESEYLSYAKSLAGVKNGYVVPFVHLSLLSYLAAIFYKLNLSEAYIKFFLEIIPSILLVALAYFAASEMYNKKIGLIASAILSFNWVILFNTNRFHTGIPSAMFALFAIYIFWKGFIKKEKFFIGISSKYSLIFVALFIFLTYAIRRGFFLIGFFFLFFFLLGFSVKEIRRYLLDRYVWFSIILLLSLLLLSSMIIFKKGNISDLASNYFHSYIPLNFDFLRTEMNFFYGYKPPYFLFYLFWIGFISIFIEVLISWDLIRKSNKNLNLKSNLFTLVSIIIMWFFFFYFIRTPGEPRQHALIFFFLAICVGKGVESISFFFKKYLSHKSNNHIIFILFVVFLLSYAGYNHIKKAEFIINSKLKSYEGVKKAGIFIKKNSSEGDIIISVSQPQVTFYSDRKTLSLPENFTDFLNLLHEQPKIKFLVITFSEPNYPAWARKITKDTWEIPFLQSKINFRTKEILLKKNQKVDGINFELVYQYGDAFVYKISRKDLIKNVSR